jgi:hypothetical protein
LYAVKEEAIRGGMLHTQEYARNDKRPARPKKVTGRTGMDEIQSLYQGL